jgi:hypothetical protein
VPPAEAGSGIHNGQLTQRSASLHAGLSLHASPHAVRNTRARRKRGCGLTHVQSQQKPLDVLRLWFYYDY